MSHYRLHRSIGRCAAALAAVVALAGAGTLAGCVAYPYYPAPYPGPSTYDRAYDAALGALTDQGLGIASQDRPAGRIVGARGALTVTASVRPQADGTTRVEFNTHGDQPADAGISQRVLSAYNARMGR